MNWLVDVFFTICQMSVSALTVAVWAVLLFGIFNLVRVPKRISYLLLVSTVLVRMLVPILPSTEYSIFNIEFVRDTVANGTIPDDGGYVGDYEVAVEGTREYAQASQAGLQPEANTDLHFDYISYTLDSEGTYQKPVTFREQHGILFTFIWLTGVLLFWGYGIVSAILLKRKVATATILEPGVYETDQISAPFILGIFQPVIYLPLGLDARQREMVLCHERMHLRWGDHIVKIVAYLAMGLYWFHVWLAVYFYRFFMYAMEEACDQDVLRKLGPDCKADYSQALLNFSTKRQFRNVMTVAFGESWIKDRIRSVLKYKKPLRVLTLPAVVLMMASVLSLSTNGIVREETFLKTVFLTHEEQEQDGLPGSVIHFPVAFADDVRSIAIDLEIWSTDGLARRQRIMTVDHLQELKIPKDSPIIWAFDLESNGAHTGFHGMGWNLLFNGEDCRGYLDFTELGGPFENGMRTRCIGLDEPKGYYLPTDDSAVLFCGFFPDERELNRYSCEMLSAAENVPVVDGRLAVILRLHVFHSRNARAATLQDLKPEPITYRDEICISADGKSQTLSGDAAEAIWKLLYDFSISDSRTLGITTLEGGLDLPKIRLFDQRDNGYYEELTICGEDLYLHESHSGLLHQVTGDYFSTRAIAAMIYQTLDLEKTAAEAYQLPQTVGDEAYGWTLVAAVPRKDLWLYSTDGSDDDLLLMGLSNQRISFGTDTIPTHMAYQDLSGDGTKELAVFCHAEEGQRLYVLAPFDAEKTAWYIDWVSVSDLNHYMASSFGEYADQEDLFEISMDAEYEVSYQFSGTEVLGDWAAGRYVHDVQEDHYQDARFYEQDGRLFVTATRILHMRKDDRDAYIPCAQVSAEICYRDSSAQKEPFVFHNFLIEPLD